MKRVIKKTFLLTVLALTLSSSVWAATSSPTPTPNVKQEQIEDLKERLATKVAQLRQTQRRAVAGNVKSKSISTLMVETATKDVKIELTDEIKVVQYLKGVRTRLTLEDVAKEDSVVVFGDYDSTLDLLQAKVILIAAPTPLYASGTVSEVNKTDFTLTLAAADDHSVVVDIEKTTKTALWSKDTGITKGGFSKINPGDTVHIVGMPVPKKEGRVSALRILNLGNLTGTITPTATPTEAANISPTATPSVTPKSSPKVNPTATP